MSTATVVKWEASALSLEVLPVWKRVARFVAGLFGFDVYEPQLIVPSNSEAVGHPGCIEIIEARGDEPPRIIYKRDAQ